MISGIQFRDQCRSHDGKYRYGQGNTRTTGSQGYIDCSGDMVLAASELGQWSFPSVSALMARWCRENGTMIPVADAFHKPGAMLFLGPDQGCEGWGNSGHVGCAIGDGTTNVTQALGHAYPASWTYDWQLGWTGAGLVPVFEYEAPPVVYPKAPKLPRIQHFIPPPNRMFGDDIRETQLKLTRWAYITKDAAMNPGAHDGYYGRTTAAAVVEFQKSSGIHPDAIVGPDTWTLLWRV